MISTPHLPSPTKKDVPQGAPQLSSIVENFYHQARFSPDTIALTASDGYLTYGELDRRSNKFARYLEKIGACPKAPIGVYMQRNCDLVVALLGIWKSGAAYLPLDTEYPYARIKFMMVSSGASIVVCNKALQSSIEPGFGRTVAIDSDWATISKEDAGPLDLFIAPDTLAYVLFTSGSTGNPKGVMIEHHSVSDLLHSEQKILSLSKRSVIAATTSISFDISVFEIFLPLSIGASIALLDRESTRDPLLLAKQVKERRISLLQATPTGWQMLLDSGFHDSKMTALCVGEPLSAEMATKFATRFKQAWNLYGPTETTIYSSQWRIQDGERVSIGKPLPNYAFYILDENLDHVPIGETGELYISGTGLARGYLNLPGLTADRFIADPFQNDGRRMYRTGDLVRLGQDDNLEYIGRIDRQIKLRGYRIELEEIEAALLKHPLVALAVAAVDDRGSSERRIIAYVVPKKAVTLEMRSVKNLLKEILPPYMVPSEYVGMESFPLTSSGKIDRIALSRMEFPIASSWTQVEPRNELEQSIAGIWKEVFKTDDISIHDHFLDLGGHSLLAMRVTSKVLDYFDVTVSMALVFSEPTIALYAAAIKQRLPHSPDMESRS